LMVCLPLYGCGSSKSDEPPVTPEVKEGQASGKVGSSGGTIEVTNPNSPIKGTKVVVPQDALDSDEMVKIVIDYTDQLPGPIDTNTVAASKAIVLAKNNDYKFKLPVMVTIPYTDTQMSSGDIPAVFYWDKTYKKYVAVGVKNIDTTNKTITYTTVHFTDFVVLSIKDFAATLPSADSGFRPAIDGFFHPNFGAYDSPGGSCLGMANYSGWYYDFKKTQDGHELYNKYRQGDPAGWEDDTTVRELISRAFMASSQIWAQIWMQKAYELGDSQTGQLLILTMTITKSPQTFLFTGDNYGHAVTVYDYDATTGKFYIYDNNFPGEVVTVNWDPTNGFSGYSKAGAYPPIKKFGFEAASTAYDVKEFETLYQGAENGWSSSKFQTIIITTPVLDLTNSCTVNDPNNITIAGTVTGGLAAAKYLVYSVNGTNGLGGQLVTLGAGGNFSFTIPKLPMASNSIMMMSTTDPKDATRRVPSAYAGYKEITIRVQGQEFFTNLGFETGDFTAWSHETHTWQNTTPGSFTPEKSGIETIGTDPIDPSIQKVYKGNYSARVNNEDYDYHISSFTQSAVVPNVTNPELRFYWTAILEDPQHDAAHQPYIDIEVTDDDAGTNLYSRHYYTNDPTYSGWRVITGSSHGVGEWKVIPWQPVHVPCNTAVGHQITLRVLAADCGYGAHGGYIYLDGEE